MRARRSRISSARVGLPPPANSTKHRDRLQIDNAMANITRPAALTDENDITIDGTFAFDAPMIADLDADHTWIGNDTWFGKYLHIDFVLTRSQKNKWKVLRHFGVYVES